MVNCYRCGTDGHVARDCQWDTDTDGRPTWCGECDRTTRLVDHGYYVQRCIDCWAWPSKGTRFHQSLPQHVWCGGCRQLIYVFDASPCGNHRPIGIDHLGHRPQPDPPAPPPDYLAARPPSREHEPQP